MIINDSFINDSTGVNDTINDVPTSNQDKKNEIQDSIQTVLKNINSENNTMENLISDYISTGGDNLRIEEENITLQIIPSEE